MLFSSTVFLFVFLPLVIFLYVSVRKNLKQYVLLFASLFFYAWGEPRYLAVMLFVCVVNYLTALGVDRAKSKGKKQFFLFTAVIANLGILGYFKYLNFFIENINELMKKNIPVMDILMPIGISFFIFQSLSYVVDVYRKDVPAQRSFAKLALYISFFPQLIAGPIVKYHDIAYDLEHNDSRASDVIEGSRRFILGLSKKVLLANSLGAVADPIFNAGYAQADLGIAWLGAIAYSLQLFFDFSGYSDMAIGLGRIFGFHFLENFNYPYISKSITEFWRRWHISLGTWFKEYVYIPLGGNRKGRYRTYVNLLMVFFVTGMWHGASWNFIVWGLWHGLFIVLERMAGIKKMPEAHWEIFRHVYTILAFVTGWVMFRADTIGQGLGFLALMFGVRTGTAVSVGLPAYLSTKVIIVLIVALLVSAPIVPWLLERRSVLRGFWGQVIGDIGLLALLIISIAYLAASTYNPFIYFRF